MAILGSATYELSTDNSRLNRGLAKAEQTARERSRRIAGSLAKIGAAGVAMGAAAGFALFKLGMMGSDLQESGTAVEAIFKDASQTIWDFGKTSRDSVALSRADFQQMAAETGPLFKAMGLSEQEAADKTIELTKRAADLASVFNKDVNEVMMAFQSGLRGETEPMQRFGADMRDAGLEAWALSKGIDADLSSMTNAEKGILRFEAALDMTSDAEGNMALNAGSAAVQLLKAKAAVKDLAATIGQGLLPVFETVLPWVRSVVDSFSLWAENNPKLMRALVIAAAALAVIAFVVGGVLLALSGIILIAPAVGVAWAIAMGPVGWIALAVIGLIALIVLLWEKWPWFQETVKAVWSWIRNLNWGALWDGVKRAAAATWDWLKTQWDNLMVPLGEAAVRLFDWVNWGAIWDGIKRATAAVWDGLKWTWFNVMGPIGEAAADLFKWVNWGAIWDGIKRATAAVWDGLKWTWFNVMGPIGEAAVNLWKGVKWGAIWDGFKGIVTGAIDIIIAAINS